MHRNLSDLGPRFKKRVTYRNLNTTEPLERTTATGASYSDVEPQPLTPILKKSNAYYYERDMMLREEEHSYDHDSINTDGGPASYEGLTDSEPNSAGTSPRRDRLPSCNSTESELVSDPDDGSALEDAESYCSSRDSRDSRERKPLLDQNSHSFHMKPESQALLMRPEVLKLRKTTC